MAKQLDGLAPNPGEDQWVTKDLPWFDDLLRWLPPWWRDTGEERTAPGKTDRLTPFEDIPPHMRPPEMMPWAPTPPGIMPSAPPEMMPGGPPPGMAPPMPEETYPQWGGPSGRPQLWGPGMAPPAGSWPFIGEPNSERQVVNPDRFAEEYFGENTPALPRLYFDPPKGMPMIPWAPQVEPEGQEIGEQHGMGWTAPPPRRRYMEHPGRGPSVPHPGYKQTMFDKLKERESEFEGNPGNFAEQYFTEEQMRLPLFWKEILMGLK